MELLHYKSIITIPFLFSFFLLSSNNGVQGFHNLYPHYQSLSTDVEGFKQVHRTGYHFQPKQNWINDPNAPMYYKGVYHFFYQYNPKGAVWGNIVWAHSVSTDMVNWIALEPALYPSKPFDKDGCWSGSATILPGNKPIILYTGVVDPKPAPGTQVQNYAIPANYSDPYLQKWIKPDDNPLVAPIHGENISQFRDPTTAWFKDEHWRMVVGSKRRNRGIVYLYRSRDFKKWTKAKHPLHSQSNTGMWECPDFYPVSTHGRHGLETSVMGENVKHVFKVSLDLTRYEYYTIGTYFPDVDKYVPDNGSIDGRAGLRYDYGNFYASKTFFDNGKSRRVLWGWANESDTTEEDIAKGWAGIQTIPRSVWLDPRRKQLEQWPIEELESLRGGKVHLSNLELKTGEIVEVKGITAAQADVDITFSFKNLEKAEPFDPKWNNIDAQALCGLKGSTVVGGVGPFGLLTLASKNLEEYTPVFFRIFKVEDDNYKVLMCSDATSSSLNDGVYKPSFAGFVDVELANNEIPLRSLIDHSVVESFGAKGRTCITSRVYPTLAVHEDAHLYVFNNGTESISIESLDAWSMKTPLMN